MTANPPNQCQGRITKGGRCSRSVRPGQQYCWQHGPRFKRAVRRITIGGVIGFALALIGLIANLEQLGLFPRQPERMSGDFRIAVAGFVASTPTGDSVFGIDLAESTVMRLQEAFSEVQKDYIVTIWGPDRVGLVKGNSPEERNISAARISDLLGADMVVYGTTSIQDNITVVLPQFYLSTERFHEAGEITGSYKFGKQIPILGRGSVSDRIEASKELTYRIQVLSRVAVGLSYYAVNDHHKALGHFQTAELTLRPQDDSVRQILLLLSGNAVTRVGNLDLAEEKYQQALRIDSQYARAFLGLGDVYYLKAQSGFVKSQDPKDINMEMLDVAAEFYEKAAVAESQFAFSDITTKTHFGLGQIRLTQAYSGVNDEIDAAIREFEFVIDEYEQTGNPRIRRLAAESHARLGLIFELLDDRPEAASRYRMASSLLENDPERQTHYEDRARRIESAGDREIQ